MCTSRFLYFKYLQQLPSINLQYFQTYILISVSLINRRMQQMQQTFNVSTLTSKLFCANSNKSKLLCCSQKCQNKALVCRNEQCQCLIKSHPDCDFTYTEKLIQKVLIKKGRLSQQLEKAIDKIDKIYQQAIQKLSIDRENLQTWRQNFGLNNEQIIFFTGIRDNVLQPLTGNLVWKVKNNIQYQQDIEWLTQSWVDDFWEKGKIKFEVLFQNLNLMGTLKIHKYEIDSKIVNNCDKLLEFFDSDKADKISRFKLLYRASENSFSVKKFKQQCTNVPNTVVLIRTQFDKIIGGFTPRLWRNMPDQQYVGDPTTQSFIFSISMGEKFQLVDSSNAIKNVPNMGPIFGGSGGWDISIAQNANVNQTSFFNFPSKYNNGKYTNSQLSYTLFCGNPSSYYTKILEWEVFQVQFSQKQQADQKQKQKNQIEGKSKRGNRQRKQKNN